MRVILDTHTFLWFCWDDPKLSEHAANTIRDTNNVKLISVASCWEIAIKVSVGKLKLGEPYRNFIHSHMLINDFDAITVNLNHLSVVAALPFHSNHRDPFDRLIIAQSQAESLPVISCDAKFDQYDVERIW